MLLHEAFDEPGPRYDALTPAVAANAQPRLGKRAIEEAMRILCYRFRPLSMLKLAHAFNPPPPLQKESGSGVGPPSQHRKGVVQGFMASKASWINELLLRLIIVCVCKISICAV